MRRYERSIALFDEAKKYLAGGVSIWSPWARRKARAPSSSSWAGTI